MCGFLRGRRAVAVTLVFLGAWCASMPARAEMIESGGQPIHRASLAGRVCADLNGSGEWKTGEGLIPDVDVLLAGTIDAGKPFSVSARTNKYGVHVFDDLSPGVYSITETQPVGFLPGKSNRLRAIGRTVVDSDQHVDIVLSAGTDMWSCDSESGLGSADLLKCHLLAYPWKPPVWIPEPSIATLLAIGSGLIFTTFSVVRGSRRQSGR
jgi:hypothetical protein